MLEFLPTLSTAGTKRLRDQADTSAPQHPPQLLLPVVMLQAERDRPCYLHHTDCADRFCSCALRFAVCGGSLLHTHTAFLHLCVANLCPSCLSLMGLPAAPTSWSRSTYCKRKLAAGQSTQVGTKLFRVQNIPKCKVCGRQGHKKDKNVLTTSRHPLRVTKADCSKTLNALSPS